MRHPSYQPWTQRQTELLGLPLVPRLRLRATPKRVVTHFGDDWFLGPRFYHKMLLKQIWRRRMAALAKCKKIVWGGDLYDPR